MFQQLRKFHDQARSFDLVILDTPKFAPTAANAEQATRDYEDSTCWPFACWRLADSS